MDTTSSGTWPETPAFGNRTLVAGIGLRRQATADELLALLDDTLAEAGLSRHHLAALATLDRKADHPALAAAAALLGIAIIGVPEHDLPAAPSPSQRVLDLAGLPSVAEAAALFHGALLVPKRRSANATCALAMRRGRYVTSSAAMASSTLSTSRAGP